ncbi:hypothetical protein ACN4EE_00465 [Geminocystis sp. CENA526]|uniref:hypothetical protein n=1 Tax=Geminocystis sp. CENA526 TaxID=1355871 RepID=UPI003D6E94AA
MSEKDNFGSGFILGTIIGGVVGGIIGTVIANKNNDKKNNWDDEMNVKNPKYSTFDDDQMEETRMSLEEKINQLNHAIDEVKVSLIRNAEKGIIE